MQGGGASNYNNKLVIFALYQINCFLFLFKLKDLCFSSAFCYGHNSQIHTLF